MDKFTRGNLLRVDVTFVDANGANVDPISVIGQYYGADAVMHVPTVTRTGVGTYRYFMDTTLLPVVSSQVLYRRAYSPDLDPAQAACEGACQIVSPGVFSP